MKEAINVFSGEVFDLFCGNDLMWESSKCKKIIETIPNNMNDNDKPLSVLPIVLEMMEQF